MNRPRPRPTLLVFIPCSLYNEDSGYLYGTVEESSEEKTKTFYIIGKLKDSSRTRLDLSTNKQVIGYYAADNFGITDFSYDLGRYDWVVLSLKACQFTLHEIISDGLIVNLVQPGQHIFILYDHETFLRSELLIESSVLSKSDPYRNNFKTLVHHLNTQNSRIASPVLSTRAVKLFNQIIYVFIAIINIVLNVSSFMQPVLKYSTLGLHIHSSLESLTWALKTSLQTKKLTLKVGNYVIATVVDVFLGMLSLYWVMNFISTSTLPQFLLNSAEIVVSTLQDLLRWLMGNPAGLKLNFALSNMLGKFFLYHINLWWTFLVVTKPVLELMFKIFLYIGRLGLSFQASILADLLALVSFHIYCIYVYAARLFNLQVSGLIALWRLFLGRKYNPLRNRVDSCQYATDQLFVGTLAFTILLFLLPTILLYYIVFTTLRLLMLGLGGLLTRVRYVLQVLPLYVTILWVMRSTKITSTIHLTVRSQETPALLLLSVQPVAESWWKTLQRCIPDPIRSPPAVEWGKLVNNLTTGKLIYPV